MQCSRIYYTISDGGQVPVHLYVRENVKRKMLNVTGHLAVISHTNLIKGAISWI